MVRICEALRQGQRSGSGVAGSDPRHEQPACRRATSTPTWRRSRTRVSAEYLAQFRSDLEAFVSREVVEACVGDYYELSPEAGRSYYASLIPLVVSGGDSFAFAIAHRDGNSVIVDLVRERRPPFMPSQVIDEFIPLLKSYRIGKVTGDRWAGGFPPEAFQKGGIRYEAEQAGQERLLSRRAAMLNSGRITLPKNDRLFNQLVSLERHVARGGHDVIDHPRDQHDDLANAAMARCGAGRHLRRLHTWNCCVRRLRMSRMQSHRISRASQRQRQELLQRYDSRQLNCCRAHLHSSAAASAGHDER